MTPLVGKSTSTSATLYALRRRKSFIFDIEKDPQLAGLYIHGLGLKCEVLLDRDARTPRQVGNSPASTSTRKTTFTRLKRLRQLSLRPPKVFAGISMIYVLGFEEKEMLYTQYVRI
jgi:hypothetical protein